MDGCFSSICFFYLSVSSRARYNFLLFKKKLYIIKKKKKLLYFYNFFFPKEKRKKKLKKKKKKSWTHSYIGIRCVFNAFFNDMQHEVFKTIGKTHYFQQKSHFFQDLFGYFKKSPYFCTANEKQRLKMKNKHGFKDLFKT